MMQVIREKNSSNYTSRHTIHGEITTIIMQVREEEEGEGKNLLGRSEGRREKTRYSRPSLGKERNLRKGKKSNY